MLFKKNQLTWIIVGLGNPGNSYAHTRHNCGFDAVDALAAQLHAPIIKKRCKALVAEAKIKGVRVILAKPQTFMNISGEAVSELKRWYKAQDENILLLYDDIDLPCGTLRIRKNGSAGTHNGMRSVVQYLGSTEFPRIRIGVGRPENAADLVNYVLQKPFGEDAEKVAQCITRAAQAAQAVVEQDLDLAMRTYNG